MAGKRVTKSVIDWTTLGMKMPAGQREAFRVFKANTDKYGLRLSELPEDLPKIDFAEYSKSITNTAMLQEFEKMYAAVSVPYPTDVKKSKATIESEEKIALSKMNTIVTEQKAKLKNVTDVIDAIDSVPPPEKMTWQMFNHYFPNRARNPNFENPGIFPHYDTDDQIDTLMKRDGMFYNTKYIRRNVIMPDEFEADDVVRFENIKADEAKAKLEGGEAK